MRRTYHSPQLVEFGSIRDLTSGGSGAATDNGEMPSMDSGDGDGDGNTP